MKKSILLLTAFAGLVACSNEKKEDASEVTTETCQVETTTEAAPATEPVKHEDTTAPAETAEAPKTA